MGDPTLEKPAKFACSSLEKLVKFACFSPPKKQQDLLALDPTLLTCLP